MQQPDHLPNRAAEVRLSENLNSVRRILAADPIWAAYAIADLQPEMAGDCRWLTASAADGEALTLIYSGLEPPVLFTMGAPSALAALLDHADLPPAVYASISQDHLPIVSHRYDLTGDLRPMWRMVLADAEAVLDKPRAGLVHPSRLLGAQAPEVLRLLAHGGPFRPDAFSPAQIDQGVFFGVYAGEELLAVGGTHVVDPTASVAAIGNMYTHPDARRRGLSTAILRAIVTELVRQQVTTIVLNVDQRNTAAQAIYLQHGFAVHTPYYEGKGYRYA